MRWKAELEEAAGREGVRTRQSVGENNGALRKVGFTVGILNGSLVKGGGEC